MALIIQGKSTCAVCHGILDSYQEICGFPAFIPNVKDKLYLFNDAGCHITCVENHPYGKEALDFSEQNYRSFKQKKCRASGGVITSMEVFFALPLLTSDRGEPLFQYNFLTLDKNNIQRWGERELFITIVSNFIAADKWQDLTEEYRFWDRVMKEITPQAENYW